MNVFEYYNNPTIKRITREFCGDKSYIIGSGKYLQDLGWELPVKVLETPNVQTFWAAYNELTSDGLDLYMPLRDANDHYLLALLDLEYFNIEGYKELYEQQLGIFFELEAFFCYLKEFFEDHYHIPILVDTTASGYHVLTKIPADSEPFMMLVELGKGKIHQELVDKYLFVDEHDFKRSKPTPENFAYAYYGLGKIMQFE